ncbi:hypothetical protein ASD25_12625 [Brevundimonas sp. Root1423]|nr:hypothetical protein ASD25_12625 [Brevundimonas sp. Root1423]
MSINRVRALLRDLNSSLMGIPARLERGYPALPGVQRRAGAGSAIVCLMVMALGWAGPAAAQTQAPWYNAWFSPSTVTVGQSTQLGMNIFNNNSSVAMTGLTITSAQLPVGLTGSNPTSTCGGTPSYNAGTRRISLSGATLPADGMCNLSLTVTASTTGSYSFTGGIVSAVAGGVTYTGVTATTSSPLQVLGPPVATSFTYGSVVAYNEGSNQTTNLNLSFSTTGNPTSYAVGSATTAQGGSVSVNNAGQATYAPPVGFRGGNDSFTWTATNAYGTSSPATTTVTIGNPTLSTWVTGSGTRGAALSGVQINVSDGKAPYSCAASVASGALPAGVSINSNCTITGTPSASGTFNFTVNVTDSSTGAGPYTAASGTVTLVIAAPTVSLSPASGALPGATAGAAYSQSFTAGAATAPYNYSLTAGALPPGLTLTGGTLSGTPTAVGTFNFTITATDSSTAGSGGPYTVANAYSVTVSPPVIALSPTLANGTIGTAYTPTVAASGGTGAYSYAVTAGALPTGVTLAANGSFSGTPTGAGTFNFTVTAADATAGPGAPYTGSQAYSVTIGAPTITLSPSLTGATVGVAYNAAITSSGGTAGYAYTITAGSLPAGLSLSATGTITGTPTAGGTFNFTATATDSSTGAGAPFTGSRGYVLTVAPAVVVVAPTNLPNGAAGTAYSQTLTASGGTGPYSFAVTAGALPPGWTLSSTGALTGTATSSDSYTFTITATDSSTGTSAPYSGSRSFTVITGSPNFTLTPPTLPATVGQAYAGSFAAGGGTAPYTYVRSFGTLPPGMTLASNGLLSGTPTAAGTFNFTVIARDTTGGPGSPYGVGSNYNFTVSAPAVALAPVALPNGSVGAGYSTTVTASGGTTPYGYSHTAGALPPGLTLDSANGTISGTPTTTGTFNFTLTATDSSTGAGAPFMASRAYAVTIGLGAQAITFNALPDASLSASPLTLSATTDSGLTVTFFSDTTAVCSVSGVTLNLLQTGTCTIRAEQAGDSTWAAAPSISRSFTVTPANLTVAAGAAAGTTVGASYSQANTASGGLAPYSYALAAGAFPPGTTLDAATGVVSGTPTVAGAFSYIVRASDGQSTPFTADTPVTTVTIGKGSQTLGFTSTAPSAVVAGPAYTVEATASSGLVPVFTLDGASTGCAIAGATVTFTSPGTCVINANQPGDSNWTAAAQVQQSFAVAANPPVAADVPGVSIPYNSAGTAIDLSAALTGGAHTSITIVAAPAHGTVTAAGDVVTYTPAAGYFGADSFTYVATGPGGTSAPATVGLTVEAPGAPTVSNRTGVAVAYGSAGTAIDLAASISGVHTSIAIGTAPAHGTVMVAGDVVTYMPAATYYGADSFTWTATGPGGTSAPATVSLTVAAPTAPTVSDRSGIAVAYGSAGMAIDLSPSISGVHSSIAVATAPLHGTASIAGDVITYTPASDYYGADSFTYTATGPGGTSSPAAVGLTVATPPPPVVDAPAPVVVEPTEGPGTTSVDLSAISSGVVTDFRVEDAPSGGSVSLVPPAGGTTGWRLAYTPAPNFMGEDHVTLVAEGPGGDSAPAQFTFRVRGKAPDLEGTSTDGETLTFEPTAGLVGGPFQGLVIIKQPEIGSAEVVGLTIVYTRDATAPTRLRAASAASPSAVGRSSIEYVVVLPFGQSQPGAIAVNAVETTPELTPLTAATLAGRPVTVSLTDTATRGPFTGAAVVSVSEGGSATIQQGGATGPRTYDLTFTPSGDFTGVAVVTYTLSNAGGATQGQLVVTVNARPDPSADPEVRGLVSAQVDTARRFTRAQTDNFHRRLEQVRRGGSGGVSNSVSLNFGADPLSADPREALRQQLGQRSDEASPFTEEPVLGAAPLAPMPTTTEAPPASGQDKPGPVGVWTAGAVDWGRRDADGQRDYRFTTSGLSAGLDAAVSDGVVLGAGVGYGQDRTKVGDNATLSEADSYLGAVYGSWRAAEGLVLDGVLGYGSLEYNSRRWSSDEGDYLFGERSGSMLFGSVSVALERTRRSLSWSPYARLSFGSVELDGFTETGSDVFALRYEALETDMLASTLGASFDWTLERRDGVLAPSLRMEWRHEFEGSQDQIVSYADWLASPDYVVGLERWARDSVSLGLGLQWRGVSGWTFGADYQGQLGSDLSSQGLKLRLMKLF